MYVVAAVAVIGLACLTEFPVQAKDCTMNDLCSCTFDDGTVADITSLGNTDDTPRFKDVLSEAEGNFYSYNPCGGFTEGNCDNASVCILNPDKSESVQIGDPGKAQFKYDDASGDLIVAYTSGTLSSLKLTEVLLICDQNACEPSLNADGQQEGGDFQLTLKTVCACPNGCDAAGPINCNSAGGGLHAGSILSFVTVPLALLWTVARQLF